MSTKTHPGECVKCSFCGGDRWTRTMVETVRIAVAEEGMIDHLIGEDDKATFVCASCGKDKIEE
jgi:hypothetical protein